MATAHEFFSKVQGQLAKVGSISYIYDLPSNTWTETSGITADISSVSPIAFNQNLDVTVAGQGFTGATAVSLNGLPAASFTVDSDTQITFTPGSVNVQTDSLLQITTAANEILQWGELLIHDPAGSFVSARYWRMLIYKPVNLASLTGSQDFDFREEIGGPDRATEPGVTYLASSDLSDAANSFDPNSANWQVSSNTGPVFIGCDFGTNVVIKEVAIAPTQGSTPNGREPGIWDMQYSDDNVTWTTLREYNNDFTYASSGQTTFDLYGIRPTSYRGDIAVAAILAEGGTLTSGEQQAVIDRVVSLPNNVEAYYGFAGQTADSHAINLRRPYIHTITWINTFIHNSAGSKPAIRATSSYGRVGSLVPSNWPQNDVSTFFYLSEIDSYSGSAAIYGAETSSSSFGCVRDDISAELSYTINNSNSVGTSPLVTGYTSCIRRTATNVEYYIDGVLTADTQNSLAPTVRGINLWGRNDDGSNDFAGIDTLGSIGFVSRALTATENLANETAENAYNIAMGR